MAEIPDFRVQQQVPIAGLADLLAQKPVREAQIKALDAERRNNRFNTLLNAVKTGSDLATAGLARSQAKQEMAARNSLAEIMGSFNKSVTRATPAFGPPTESGQSPLALERTTFGQTPEYESQLLSRAAAVAPEQFGARIAQRAFPDELDPLDRLKKIKEIEKLSFEAKSGNTEAVAKLSNTIRDDFFKESAVFSQSADSYQRVVDAENTGPGDIALIYGYIKLLDPTSVVREGEFATAAQAQGVPARVVAIYNKALAGERLAPATRGQFKAQAKKLYGSQERKHGLRERQFRGLATRAGADPDQVVIDLRVPDVSLRDLVEK